jgi:ABC-type sugar transport system permease subunit
MAKDTAIKRKKFKISKATKDKLKGLVFVSPFIMGLCLFFIYPIYMSLKLSFGKVDNIVGFKISWIGFENYVRAFMLDTEFIPTFLQVVKNTLTQFPLTIVLSLIIAIIINKDIKGRALFRIAFFIPFLLGTGEVMRQLLYQGVDKQVLSISDGTIIPYNILNYFGATVVNAVQGVFGTIVSVLWASGVQILLFLAGLQSISPALYEAAKIDGATEWEIFWKVTIPMISPMLLLNLIYTIVDSFTNIRNQLLEYIQSYGFTKAEFHYAAALGWIYFAFIGLIVIIVFGLMKGYMHTNEVEEVKKGGKERTRKVIAIERKAKRY